MTTNSVLCNFIIENPSNWRELIENKNIHIEDEDGLTIFNYNMIDCDFSDPVVQESRGIILDVSDVTNPTVVAWPFRKFGNYSESYADTIDWTSARIQEKVDGSIIKYWYDKRKNEWRFSTNGKIVPLDNFMSLLNEAKMTSMLKEDRLDKDCTYIFELISPRNQIVIKYNQTTLVHLGVRNNLTGEESKAGEIGVATPKEYHIDDMNLDACVELAQSLNKVEGIVDHEGFVVVDKNWHRIKVKSPEYLLLHKQIGNRTFAKKDCLDLIFFKAEQVENFVKSFSLFAPMVRYYQYQQELYYNELDTLNAYVDALAKEYCNDRKAIALSIQTVPSEKRWVLFEHLKHGEDVRTILQRTPLTKLEKLFPDYVETDALRYIRKSVDS